MTPDQERRMAAAAKWSHKAHDHSETCEVCFLAGCEHEADAQAAKMDELREINRGLANRNADQAARIAELEAKYRVASEVIEECRHADGVPISQVYRAISDALAKWDKQEKACK